MKIVNFESLTLSVGALVQTSISPPPEPPKGCRTKLNYTLPNLSVLALPRNAYFVPVGENLPPGSLASDSAIGPNLLQNPAYAQHYDDGTIDSLFLSKAALLSIYLLLKPLSSKLLTPPFAAKKNCV